MTSNWTFGEGEKITYGFTPSMDDSSSEEGPDDQEDRIKQLLKYQEINMLQDK
ncbi:hypothetical protein CGCA056_v000112 [Colletotrichum aenigma]|uniref:uncharacterized protein n=1 Tax=Colletotrichum aenigma TaxID=1215731 RepID=UPI001872CEA6|nr:uncharacterized protein CGCA056_v000112 [Colletotrichum aenigma]KAF5528362.1 hypothetical protein CGCA056_v000112 [Colletotrichum aenigma]